MLNSTTCKPIECLNDVLNWTRDNKRNYVTRKLKLSDNTRRRREDDKEKKVKVILCHDMRNNYLEDKYFQGVNAKNGYRFYDWNQIEYFIYFSHHFITIPPESWTNASHCNNVPMLATLITEHIQGFDLCEKLFSDKSLIDKFVSKLVDITLFYGFDGWLLNIENKIREEQIGNLIYFIKLLVNALRTLDSSRYKVIWYDSVINNGSLHWQNELNELNECFFNETDSIFINYTWKEENLSNSFTNAKDRLNDVYVGVDVFGRNCFGGGGFSCNVAFAEIAKKRLNAAIFAPGWVVECNDEEKFVENEQKFWLLLEPYTAKQKLKYLPLVSTFNQGCGEFFTIKGLKIDSGIGSWFNLNLQTLQPSSNNQLKWCFDDSFYAGSCIEAASDAETKLFDLEIKLQQKESIRIRYAFKLPSNQDPKVHLNLSFSNSTVFYKLGATSDDKVAEEDFKLLNFKEFKNSSDWYVRDYILEISSHQIDLNSLTFSNNHDFAVKLGFLSIHKDDTGEAMLKQVSNLSLKNKSCIRLDNKHFYFVEINWNFDEENKLLNNFNYFNLFLKQSDDSAFKFIGSTTCKSFNLCLELTNFYFNFSQNSDYNTEASKTCKLLVQCVNEDHEFEDFERESSTIEIEIPGRASISRVVTDFENIF